MSEWVNERPLELESYFDEWSCLAELRTHGPLVWLTPLRDDGYRELRDGLWERARLPEPSPQAAKFWPQRGPQWDGVAVVRGSDGETRGILLVEAKSHLGELESSPTGAEGGRLETIRASLSEVKGHLCVPHETEWVDRYYQITNRLAYLYYLRVRLGFPACLLWVYFLGDGFGAPGHRVFPATEGEWRPAVADAKSALGLPDRHDLSQHTHEAFIPADPRKKDPAWV
jgi:hypothetical protein